MGLFNSGKKEKDKKEKKEKDKKVYALQKDSNKHLLKGIEKKIKREETEL